MTLSEIDCHDEVAEIAELEVLEAVYVVLIDAVEIVLQERRSASLLQQLSKAARTNQEV